MLEHGGVLMAVRDALRAGVDVPSAYLRKRDDKDPSGGMRFHDVAAQLLQLLSQFAEGRRLVMTRVGFQILEVGVRGVLE